jgi:N-methylhydantoinase B
MNKNTELDPITLTVVWDGLRGLCDEMGFVLQRTSYSQIVRDAGDCAAAVFDRHGRNIAQGVFSPGHIVPMGLIVRNLLERWDVNDIHPGDSFITNDIYIGAGQLNDAFTITPISIGAELLGFVSSSVHLMDVGGASPGGLGIAGIYDNYQEGLRIPFLRHYQAGMPVQGVMDLILNNVRFPKKVLGDMRAMLNANNYGTERLSDLAVRYGVDTLNECYSFILSDSEKRMRAGVASLRPGVYSYELQLDDYGPGTPPVRLAVDIAARGDKVVVDWSRTSGQVPAAMNSGYNYSSTYTIYALKCLLAPEVPINEACFRPIDIVIPEGSFLNPRPPAPGGGRAVIVNRLVETIFGALAPALPGRAMGASAQYCNTSLSGEWPDGRGQYLFWDLLCGGYAGRSNKDGAEALCAVVNARNIPVEMHELDNPVLIERLQLVPDTGGPGEYRGACSVRKDIRLLGLANRLTTVGDRHITPPHGLAGGAAGDLARVVRNPNGDAQILHPKGVYLLDAGEVVRIQSSGAGGYGHPHERDPNAVLEDVREGYVSRESALTQYGVATTDTMEVDWEKTDLARLSGRDG